MDAVRRAEMAARMRVTIGATCVATVVGMIVCAVTHHVGGVVALGCISSGAVVVLLAITVVAPTGQIPGTAFDTTTSAQVEALIGTLVERGTGENELRTLVGAAVELGRSAHQAST